MYRNFFKRRWICQEAVDYLMSLPKMYRVYYMVQSGNDLHKLLIRDEDCVQSAILDWKDSNVVCIGVQYQEDGFSEYYHVNGYIDQSDVSRMKETFDKFIAKYTATNSALDMKSLYSMQHQLRTEIERVCGVQCAYDGKDLIYNLTGISQEGKERVLDMVRRFNKDCVEVAMIITIAGSTDERIGSTLDELAMYEVGVENSVE